MLGWGCLAEGGFTQKLVLDKVKIDFSPSRGSDALENGREARTPGSVEPFGILLRSCRRTRRDEIHRRT